MSKQLRGAGNIYLRGSVWWVQYSHRGERFRESSESSDRAVALKLLKQRLSETVKGKVIGRTAEKVTLGEMRQALLDNFALKENRSTVTVINLARHLIAYFGENTRALDISADRIEAYAVARKGQGASNATVNRETAALLRMFNIMAAAGRLSRDNVPTRTVLPEAAARTGFLEPSEFSKLRDALPEFLREAASFLYITGWRKGAMRSLQWARDLDLEIDAGGVIIGGTVTLQAEFSKSKRRVTLPLKGELLEVIKRAWISRLPECPFVFRRGSRSIGDFRKAWSTACVAAGVGAILPPRYAAQFCKELGEKRRERAGGNESHRARNPKHVRPLQHRCRVGP